MNTSISLIKANAYFLRLPAQREYVYWGVQYQRRWDAEYINTRQGFHKSALCNIKYKKYAETLLGRAFSLSLVGRYTYVLPGGLTDQILESVANEF